MRAMVVFILGLFQPLRFAKIADTPNAVLAQW